MKFMYVDESGGPDIGDAFVMCGVMVDAYKIRSKTQALDDMLQDMLRRHPGQATELKTGQFINGKRGWSRVDAEVRKRFLEHVCEFTMDGGGQVYAICLSIKRVEAEASRFENPFNGDYWLAAAMFTVGLIQKKMQKKLRNKGLTVVVMDDNRRGIPKLATGIHQARDWFDGLYQLRNRGKRGGPWVNPKQSNRFDQIVNTPFAIKSNHSSLIQAADALSYVYRRDIELQSVAEKWLGEKAYYAGLVESLEKGRAKLGDRPRNSNCVRYYERVKHVAWQL